MHPGILKRAPSKTQEVFKVFLLVLLVDLVFSFPAPTPVTNYLVGIADGATTTVNFQLTSAPHFNAGISNTDNNATIIVPTSSYLAMDTNRVEIDDEIGIFTPRNICAGLGTWDGQNLSITIWGDDTLNAGILGFQAGENYTFKLWDFSAQQEYEAIAVFDSGTAAYQVNGISIIDSLYYRPAIPSVATTPDTLDIPLEAGWNQISINVQPNDASVQQVMQPIQGQTVIMKNGRGEVYWPQYNINQINTFRVTDGYQIKMDTSATLQIVGSQVQPDTVTYSLASGWNLISFPGPDLLSPDTGMASLGNKLVVLKDGYGNIYYPNYHIRNIGEMHIGQGYWVYVNAATTFRYSLSLPKLLAHFVPGKALVVPHNTGSNAILLITQKSDPLFQKAPLSPGDEIRVYSSEEHLVGRGIWKNANLSITIWGDDPLTKPVEGLVNDEPLQIRVWDQETNEELRTNVSYSSKDSTYTDNALIIVKHLEAIKQADTWQATAAPDTFSLQQNFPNPVANHTIIRYVVPRATEVSITIFDVLGQRVKTLVSGEQLPGSHIVTWDGSNDHGTHVSDGMYIYLMRAPGFRESRKLILAQ